MKKKLIEVALPLEAINKASAREKSIRHGHPSALHLWWSRKPTATARAIIFAQMVDDPSAHPDQFPTETEQENERKRLFDIIEDLVEWEKTTDEYVLNQARDEIWKSWRYTCEENKDHPYAAELFNPDKLPAFHDPFAGGGSIPLEAQRLGLKSYASDLNPVAVLINKAMIEIPPKFANRPPVNPESRKQKGITADGWKGAQGLAEDVRYYGKWMRDEAEKRIGHLYPKIEITNDMAEERPDLKRYVGQKLTVIGWLWARTVKSPNPAFAHVDVPLASTFMLSTKAGKEAFVEPVIEGDSYRFTVKVGKPKDAEAAKNGTKVGRGGHFQCLISGSPMRVDYIREQGIKGNLGQRMMAIVAEGLNGRIYLAPDSISEKAAQSAKSIWSPEQEINHNPRDIRTQLYGLTKYSDLFTPRQLVALTTLSNLVLEAREQVKHDAFSIGMEDDKLSLNEGGNGVLAYGDALGVYLGFGVSKLCDYNSSLVSWSRSRDQAVHVFGRQALPMVWDYVEVNPLAGAAGDLTVSIEGISRTVATFSIGHLGVVTQADAQTQTISMDKIISTDPPYYDNISYADLSDYFYIWLRNSLKSIFSDLFITLVVPKSEELMASPSRHGSKEKAEIFFLEGMTRAMKKLAEAAHNAFPVTIYYAFKQSETEKEGTASTGWETFLEALIQAGFTLSGTWPMRTEREGRINSNNQNSLASSIVLVCRKRDPNAPTVTRREFLTTLKTELPEALKHLQHGNIAPVDLAQAAIGPGMAVYTRFSKVLDAKGKAMTVREALSLINQTLDEVLAEQEGDFDSDSRWALAWFEQYGFGMGKYGDAETLSKAKNTSVSGMVDAGILESKSGEVRMLMPAELPVDWDPIKDDRLTVWEIVHHLIRVLEAGGETAAAELVAKLGSKADTAKELAYRLYVSCDRKKRTLEALSYNALVQSWPEIMRLAKGEMVLPKGQMHLIEEEE